jgi:hypothetical protein
MVMAGDGNTQATGSLTEMKKKSLQINPRRGSKIAKAGSGLKPLNSVSPNYKFNKTLNTGGLVLGDLLE